jgi:hypothetical protein
MVDNESDASYWDDTYAAIIGAQKFSKCRGLAGVTWTKAFVVHSNTPGHVFILQTRSPFMR